MFAVGGAECVSAGFWRLAGRRLSSFSEPVGGFCGFFQHLTKQLRF